jgi:DNA repair photolyase
MPFDWSLNPYRGCQHGCSFCYARATHRFLDLACDDTFQHHILYKENAVQALEEQLKQMAGFRHSLHQMGLVAIGTATDPYQPIEGKLRLTRQCLELLARYQVPISITTRSPLILRDIDLLKKCNLVSINISINTLNREVWRMLEPASPHPKQRMKTVGRLVKESLPAGIFLAPIIPFLTDRGHDLEQVISSARAEGARFVMPSYLRLNAPEVKTWFMGILKQRYPSLIKHYKQLYQNNGLLPHTYRQRIDRHIETLLHQYQFSSGTNLEKEKRDERRGKNPEQLSFAF